MGKERIAELDSLRGLAFLAVVLQHAIGVYIRKEDIPFGDAIMLGILFNIVKFAVPMFIFITGIVLLYNYYDTLNYPKFIYKRFVEIFVPYLIWSLIYNLYYQGFATIDLQRVAVFVKQLILGNAAYHLWFVIMIFQFYLLYPILRQVLKILRAYAQSLSRFYLLLGLVTIAYTLLMWFSSFYIPKGYFQVESELIQKIFVKYRSINALYYSYYFLLGAVVAFGLKRWRELINKISFANGIIFIFLFLWVGLELMTGVSGSKVDLNYSTSLKPSMFFYTVSSILLLYGVALKIAKEKTRSYKILAFVGRYSYGAYLIHALALTYAVRGIASILASTSYLELTLLAFSLAAVLSVSLAYLISLTPFKKLLIGP